MTTPKITRINSCDLLTLKYFILHKQSREIKL